MIVIVIIIIIVIIMITIMVIIIVGSIVILGIKRVARVAYQSLSPAISHPPIGTYPLIDIYGTIGGVAVCTIRRWNATSRPIQDDDDDDHNGR
jgi:hypothetical protein